MNQDTLKAISAFVGVGGGFGSSFAILFSNGIVDATVIGLGVVGALGFVGYIALRIAEWRSCA